MKNSTLSLDVTSPHARARASSRHVARRTCVHLLAGSPQAEVRRIPFSVLERKSTLISHPPAPQPFLDACPWRSLTTQLSAPRVAALARVTLASHASCTPPRALVGLPWLPLISLRPSCLDGCLSHVSKFLRTLVYILWPAQSSGSSHPPWLSSQCHPSLTLSSSCSS